MTSEEKERPRFVTGGYEGETGVDGLKLVHWNCDIDTYSVYLQ